MVAQSEADWILKAMVAVAAADGRLDAREVGLIQQVYQDQTGRPVDVSGVARAAEAYTKRDVLVELSAVAGGMSPETKEAALGKLASPALDRLTIHAASEVVEMHEPPADALRKKKDSSMRVAVNLVKDEVAQACVSAGNTGALMAISRFVLKTLPGIDRPAIAAQLPTRTGVVTVLDLGANVNCSPEQLVQFAVMGSAYSRTVLGISKPRVKLLNIGTEDLKGTEELKEAAGLSK